MNNTRNTAQRKIMVEQANNGLDPLDPAVLKQPILFKTQHWAITANRFPYNHTAKHYLAISRKPWYDITSLNSRAWAELGEIVEELGLDGGALCMRFGDTSVSGASCTRVHCHFIQPIDGGKVKFAIGSGSAT